MSDTFPSGQVYLKVFIDFFFLFLKQFTYFHAYFISLLLV